MKSEDGKKWVKAPAASMRNAAAVDGVWLAPGESVRWSWCHTGQGSYVNGYEIVEASGDRVFYPKEKK